MAAATLKNSMGRGLLSLLSLLSLLALLACSREPRVGDQVLVERKGAEHPAVIVSVQGPSKFRVHYIGYSDEWDETIPGTRLRGRLPGPIPTNIVPQRGGPGANPSPSASATPSFYRIGDRVRVEWHRSIYNATIVEVLGSERYRVHYEGYGDEWDEDIGLERIRR